MADDLTGREQVAEPARLRTEVVMEFVGDAVELERVADSIVMRVAGFTLIFGLGDAARTGTAMARLALLGGDSLDQAFDVAAPPWGEG